MLAYTYENNRGQFAIQHSPSNWEKSKQVCKMLCFGAWKRLSQKVGSHVLGRTIYELDRAIFNQVVDKMPPNVNMFCSGMKLPLRMSKCDGGRTVRIKSNGVFEWSKDFTQKAPEPNQFLGGMHGSDIFSFSSQQGYKFLLLRTPRNSSSVDQNNVPGDCLPMLLHGSIGVCKPFQTMTLGSPIN